MGDLAAKFHERMLVVYRTASAECGYRPTYLLRLVNERGGLGAAQMLLATEHPAAGLPTLWGKSRLDLSLEAAVLEPAWSDLFSADDRAIATKRLRRLGYQH